MEFLQLKYFKHAAKTENFSHTAMSFRVPASCVSSSVKKLEEEIGEKLFERSSNTIRLSEKGRIFLKAVEKIFEELDNASVEMAELSGETVGKINLRINTNRHIFTPLISEFSSKYPKVTFTIDFDGEKNHSSYDIIVTDELLEGSGFSGVDFVSEELFLAVNNKNPLALRERVYMRELSEEKFICLRKNHRLRNVTDMLFSRACIAPDIAVECNDIQCISDYLKMGMGVSVVPGVSWRDRMDSTLHMLRINDGVYRNTRLYINNKSSKASHVFYEFLKNGISQ